MLSERGPGVAGRRLLRPRGLPGSGVRSVLFTDYDPGVPEWRRRGSRSSARRSPMDLTNPRAWQRRSADPSFRHGFRNQRRPRSRRCGRSRSRSSRLWPGRGRSPELTNLEAHLVLAGDAAAPATAHMRSIAAWFGVGGGFSTSARTCSNRVAGCLFAGNLSACRYSAAC